MRQSYYGRSTSVFRSSSSSENSIRAAAIRTLGESELLLKCNSLCGAKS